MKEETDLVPVTQNDIESLAEKLDGLAASMTDGERAALARVILNAAQASRSYEAGATSRAAFSGPLATSLAVGSNFTPEGQGPPIVAIQPGELRSKERVFFRGITR